MKYIKLFEEFESNIKHDTKIGSSDVADSFSKDPIKKALAGFDLAMSGPSTKTLVTSLRQQFRDAIEALLKVKSAAIDASSYARNKDKALKTLSLIQKEVSSNFKSSELDKEFEKGMNPLDAIAALTTALTEDKFAEKSKHDFDLEGESTEQSRRPLYKTA